MPGKNKKKYPKIGLALSGGSALGICHIGVIKAFRENKIPIDCVSGTSAGAIAAVCLAFGIPMKKMVDISKKVNWASISKFGYSRMGINSNHPVGEMISEIIDGAKIEDAKIPLAIMTTDVDSGEKIVLKKGSVAEAIMASTCLPGFFIPVEIKGKKLVDGGLVENLPISPLYKMKADIKIGVNLKHWRKLKKSHNVLDVIANSYSILTGAQEAFVPAQADILIEPHLEKFFTSDFKKADKLIEEGYRAAKFVMPQIKKLINDKREQQKGFFQKIADFFRE